MADSSSSIIITSQELSAFTLQYLDDIRKQSEVGSGVWFPIPQMGAEYVGPIFKKDLFTIMAQTSHGKSTFMYFWEHFLAKQLMAQKRNSIIIHMSLEEVAEDIGLRAVGNEAGVEINALMRGSVQDWKRLEQAAVRVGNTPIFNIGSSLARADQENDLYLSNLLRAVEVLESGKVISPKPDIAAIFVDYLQALPFDPEVKKAPFEMQRRLQVASDVDRLRVASKRFAPVILGCQAKQDLTGALGKDMLLPGAYDGSETMSIGTRSDRLISMWMPSGTHGIGRPMKHGDYNFVSTPEMVWFRVVKQRGGFPKGRCWEGEMDFVHSSYSVKGGGQDFDGNAKKWYGGS